MDNIKLEKLKTTLNNSLLFTVIFGITAILLSGISSYLIIYFFPHRVVSPDLIFSLTSYNLYIEYLADILPPIAVILFLRYYVKDNWDKILFYINHVSLMYFSWSFLKLLTPLMRPTGADMPSHGFLKDYVLQTGMFPSGHAGLTALMFFLVEGQKYRNLKKVLFIILVVESISMVVSRGHYSIDVVGGIFLSYFIANEMKVFAKDNSSKQNYTIKENYTSAKA